MSKSTTSFLTDTELTAIGLCSYGSNVLVSRFARFYSPETIAIGSNVRIDDFCILSGGAGISIGSFVHIGCYSSIFGQGSVEIGDFANISSRVAIYSESDDPSGKTLTNPMIPSSWKQNQKIARVSCGKHSVAFTNSTILPGASLGEGTVLGAHSLATQDLSPWWIYAGVPASRIRERQRGVQLQESKFLAWSANPHGQEDE